MKVILIQVDEAHSSAWPRAIGSVDIDKQTEPHNTFQDRIDRAKHFVAEYSPPYPVFIDNWNNEFAELFRAWPDQYHCVDSNLRLIAKSEYGAKKEATINKDYTVLLNELMDLAN